MAINLTFYPRRRLGIAHADGPLTAEQLANYLAEWDHPHYVNYDEIFISKGFNPGDLSYSDVLSHADHAIELNRLGSGEVRSAIVVDEGISKKRAEYWASATTLTPYHHRTVRVFTSEIKARQWLAEPRIGTP